MRFGRRISGCAHISAICMMIAVFASPGSSVAKPVQADAKAVTGWPSYFGNDRAWSYSALKQINRQNVAKLTPAWTLTVDTTADGLSVTPLVLDGVLFLPTPQNEVLAMDAATGHLLWTYKSPPAQGRVAPRKPIGLAAGLGLIFLAGSDHHLTAIDQKTGHEVWNVEISDPRQCGCGPSAAPILVKDKVIVGVSSNDTGHRGYLDAYNAKTGKLAWRFWAIPGPGEPGHTTWPENLWRMGTTSTWLPGSFDPDLNLIYWGMGNPGPMLGGKYAGDKLYSDSLVALDADTGKLKWYYQQIPNDKLDYDSVLEPILIDADVGGKMRKLVVQPTKSGFTYVLDRATGAFIKAYPFASTINWTKGLDSTGHPLDPRLELKVGVDTLICPGTYGARAAGHSTFSPHTGLWYNSSYETCTIENAVPSRAPQEAVTFTSASFRETHIAAASHPFIAAFDPVTGDRKWTYVTNSVNPSSLLSTAGDIVFGGDVFGNVWGLDALAGKQVWSYNVGTGISSMPITYAVNGRQYIAVSAGLSFVATALSSEVATPEQRKMLVPHTAKLVVFALPRTQGSAAP